MRTIFVPVGGSASDESVLTSSMTLARLLGLHLEFVHVHIDAVEAASHTPHMGSARGAAMRNALHSLAQAAETRASEARRHVGEVCRRYAVELVDRPGPSAVTTARWREEQGEGVEHLLAHAMRNDLTVMARPVRPDGLAQGRLETLLLRSGRPLLITAQNTPLTSPGTVMVCWRDTPEAVRALACAMPLLSKAGRVLLVSVDEGQSNLRATLDELAGQLSYSGIRSEAHVVPRNRRPVQDVLAATAAENKVDLAVMGAYGRRPMTELLLGGCTASVLSSAAYPVLLMH